MRLSDARRPSFRRPAPAKSQLRRPPHLRATLIKRHLAPSSPMWASRRIRVTVLPSSRASTSSSPPDPRRRPCRPPRQLAAGSASPSSTNHHPPNPASSGRLPATLASPFLHHLPMQCCALVPTQACSSPVSARTTTTTLDAVLNPHWWSPPHVSPRHYCPLTQHDFLCCGLYELQCGSDRTMLFGACEHAVQNVAFCF